MHLGFPRPGTTQNLANFVRSSWRICIHYSYLIAVAPHIITSLTRCLVLIKMSLNKRSLMVQQPLRGESHLYTFLAFKDQLGLTPAVPDQSDGKGYSRIHLRGRGQPLAWAQSLEPSKSSCPGSQYRREVTHTKARKRATEVRVDRNWSSGTSRARTWYISGPRAQSLVHDSEETRVFQHRQ